MVAAVICTLFLADGLCCSHPVVADFSTTVGRPCRAPRAGGVCADLGGEQAGWGARGTSAGWDMQQNPQPHKQRSHLVWLLEVSAFQHALC